MKDSATQSSGSSSTLRRVARVAAEPVRALHFLTSVYRGEYEPAPHSIKMHVLKSYMPKASKMTFIETGTFFGDTVNVMSNICDRVISIEIDPALHRSAKIRFQRSKNVELILGDCTAELPKVLARLDDRAVFWLDGHWSGGVTGRGILDDPILVSLRQINDHPNKSHLLFIDDARAFQSPGSGPDIVDVLSSIRAINSSYMIRIHSDIIIATLAP